MDKTYVKLYRFNIYLDEFWISLTPVNTEIDQ